MRDTYCIGFIDLVIICKYAYSVVSIEHGRLVRSACGVDLNRLYDIMHSHVVVDWCHVVVHILAPYM